MSLFSVASEQIDCAALSASMQDDSAGAFVSFEGRVRDNNEGFSVTSLDYEIFHHLASTEGDAVLREAIERFQLSDARAVHREGSLYIGDCAIWIGVTARHRGEAFAGCRYIIDEIKHRLPVWKKEHYTGVEPLWVNCQHHHNHVPLPAITEKDFYARQTILPEIGQAGQAKLKSARVLVAGVGGLGSAASLALAGAGVGTIGLADYDVLSVSNLHRQVLYTVSDLGKPKAGLAAARLKSLNPFVAVQIHQEKITADNIASLFDDYDLVLDCTDNFTAKYLLNDAAVLYKKPVIQASIYKYEGQILVIDPEKDGACLRCLFPEPPVPGMVGDCATAGVLGTVPMYFGTLQANEAIKLILGLPVSQGLKTFDLLTLQGNTLSTTRDPACKVCGDHKTKTAPEQSVDFYLESGEALDDLAEDFTLIDVREAWEIEEQPLTSEAIHLPTSAFDISRIDIAHDKKILVICAHGVRSQTAAHYLRQLGWSKAYSLANGVSGLYQAKRRA